MPRRKKTTEGAEKKVRRVSLAVRVAAKPVKPKTNPKKNAGATEEARENELEAAREEVIIPEIAVKKDPVNVEKQKQMIMWVGVTFFMVVIVFFWLFNIGTIFKTENKPAADEQFDLAQISARFSETMNTLSGELANLKDNAASSTATSTAPVAASSTPPILDASTGSSSASSTGISAQSGSATGTVSQAEVEALKARLLELEKRLGAESSVKPGRPTR